MLCKFFSPIMFYFLGLIFSPKKKKKKKKLIFLYNLEFALFLA